MPRPTRITLRSGATVSVLVGVLLLPLAVNVATDTIPDSWRPFLWIAWPVAVLLSAWSVWSAPRQPPASPSSADDPPASSPPSAVQVNSARSGGTVYGVQHGTQIVHPQEPRPEQPPHAEMP